MESTNQFHESFRLGLIVGYIFAVTFVVVFYMSYSLPPQLLEWRKHKKRRNNKVTQKLCLPQHKSKQDTIKEKRRKARQIDKLLPVELLEKRIQISTEWRLTCRMSFTKISNATEHFSEESAIGVGMIGVMYKAMLPNGLFLAVKRLYDSQLCIKKFEIEIMILGRYNHRNIVPLIGFCIEEQRNERILVYQYMSNGRLSDWLNETTKLEWHVVIRIAHGVARGLSCLHHSLHMAHLSICSECILLENNFEPKISNFGCSKFMNHNLGNNIRFEKKDVYDFVCLLFEMIRGKKFGEMRKCFSDAKGPFSSYTYPNPVNMMEDPFGFYETMDKSLKEIEFEDEVSALLRVACDCVHPFPNERPTMLEVYSKMSNIWERDEICEDSFSPPTIYISN